MADDQAEVNMRLLAIHDADLAREVAELRKVVIRVLDNQAKSRALAWLTRACWLYVTVWTIGVALWALTR